MPREHGPESGKSEQGPAPSQRQTRVVDAKKERRKKFNPKLPRGLDRSDPCYLHSFSHTMYVVQEAYTMKYVRLMLTCAYWLLATGRVDITCRTARRAGGCSCAVPWYDASIQFSCFLYECIRGCTLAMHTHTSDKTDLDHAQPSVHARQTTCHNGSNLLDATCHATKTRRGAPLPW